MAVMTSTNAIMNASCLGESRNFRWNFRRKPEFPRVYFNCRRVDRLNSQKSRKTVIFCLNLNTKEVGLQSSGDRVLEFKRNFDQYLQIMESVKTERENKKVDRLLKDKADDSDKGRNGDSGNSEVRVSERRLELRSAENAVKRKSGEPKDVSFRRRHSRQEMVTDKGNEIGLKRDEKRRFQRITKDVKWIKSGESSVAASEDESLRRIYPKQGMVRYQPSSDTSKRIRIGSKGADVDAIVPEITERQTYRITKDTKWIKNGEASVIASEDESLRKRYSKQDMVRYQPSSDTSKRISISSKGDELDVIVPQTAENQTQRVTKGVKWIKSSESSVNAAEDESFSRRNSKQEMVKYERSSDTSKGTEIGSKFDELDVIIPEFEERQTQRITKSLKWSKSGDSSMTAPKDESYRRSYLTQEIDRYQRSSDTSKRIERVSNEDELDLAVEERRIQRIANEMSDLRSSKLSRTRGIAAKRDDDSLFDIESPAFRFSDESSDPVDKPATSQAEMEERIEKLAKGLNGADINMPEWLFSKAIRSARIRYSDYTIMRLIQSLGKLGNWRRVLQVIEWLQRQDRYKSNKLRIIYTAALNVLGKSRRPVEALNVFHAMQLQISSYPDMVAYRSIAVTLGQAGHIKELFDVIDTMRSTPKKKLKPTTLEKWDPRLEPDLIVYNAVLNACVQRKQWEGAFWVLQQLKQRGQKPSAVTYGLVVEVMFACEKYNLVHEFFKKMQKSSIPNALAYRVLVNTLWKEGKIDEAAEMVQDMERRGIVGSAALYYDLSRCFCSAGRCDEGLDLVKKICRVASKPLVVTYTGLIQACIDAGNIKNAAYIFDQMKEVCNPNLVTYNIMLKAYLQNGLFKEAREIFKKISEDGDHITNGSDYKSKVLPDTYSFNTMLDACAEHKNWDDFSYAYTQMLRHGYHFNAKRHLRMVLEANRAGKEEVMEATCEHLRRNRRKQPPSLIKERFCRKLEIGDYVSAISSIADLNGNIEETELQAFSSSAWSKLLKQNSFRFEEDSVLRLMDDVNRVVGSRSDSSDWVLGNLLSSCKEFLKNRTQVI